MPMLIFVRVQCILRPENHGISSCTKVTKAEDRIKKAYYDKMKICHPDVAGDDGRGHSCAGIWMICDVQCRHCARAIR